MAHTPGPWRWDPGENAGSLDLVAPLLEEEALAGEEGAPFPKWLHVCTNAFDLGNPADLAVIEAAPELLSAAKNLVHTVALAWTDGYSSTDEAFLMLDQAIAAFRPAIAKAERRM